jgi:hypothetical protein
MTRASRFASIASRLSGAALIALLENRFLVTVGVVKAAALDARRRGKVLHGRVVEALAPEHIKRDRDDLLLVKLTRTHHFPTLHPLILDNIVKFDILVKHDVILEVSTMIIVHYVLRARRIQGQRGRSPFSLPGGSRHSA